MRTHSHEGYTKTFKRGNIKSNMLDERWSKIMQEVDRLYHINHRSESRIDCITDYIIHLLNGPLSGGKGEVLWHEKAKQN